MNSAKKYLHGESRMGNRRHLAGGAAMEAIHIVRCMDMAVIPAALYLASALVYIMFAWIDP